MIFPNMAPALLAAGVLAFAAAQAQATVAPSISFTGTSPGFGVPGVSPAQPTLTIEFNGPYDFIGVGFSLEYDPAFLSFNAAASAVTIGGTQYTLPAFEAALALLPSQPGFSDFTAAGGDDGLGKVLFSAGFTNTGSMALTGTVVLQTAFDLRSPAFAVGMTKPLKVASLVFFDSSGNIDELSPPGSEINLSVTAVPEPASWLMMIAGAGLLGAVARRRRR